MKVYVNGKIEEFEDDIIPVEIQINDLKEKLAETDYKAIKYGEGWYTKTEYAPIKAEREAIREQIRALEKENGSN